MTLTLSELLLATKTRRPSGLTETPRGRLPTAMVLITVRVVASITVTSSDFSLVTNTRASALASAGRMTRTSRTSGPSNLGSIDVPSGAPSGWSVGPRFPYLLFDRQGPTDHPDGDRKSTRLNSSHLGISYAVFCLKKKKNHSIHVRSRARAIAVAG